MLRLNIARWRRSWCGRLAFSLPVCPWCKAKMALDARKEVIIIPSQAVTNAFHGRQVDFGLRDLVVGVRILRMTAQPLLHMRWHRWLLLRLFDLLRLLPRVA